MPIHLLKMFRLLCLVCCCCCCLLGGGLWFTIYLFLSLVPPKVFLVRKDPSSPVVCQVTGFYPANLTITWMRDGRAHNNNVELGKLLLNENGTFQISSTLKVTADDWNWYQYYCEVTTPYDIWISKGKADLKLNTGKFNCFLY